jgi:DNA-binding LacI/PurR family transcriptional regulator
MRDVARQAGVSPGTVSRVLNDSPLVTPRTRQRVLDVVRALNYSPNLLAQRLSTGRTLTIAVVVPFLTRPSVTERLNGAMSALSQSAYDLLIHNVDSPARRADCFGLVLRRRQADGVLIVSLTPTEQEAAQLAGARVPIVLLDADHPALTMLSRVTVDDVAGGESATRHLLELGHRRIAFLGDRIENPFNFRSSRDRWCGYRKALEAAGIEPRPEYYAEGEHGRVPAARLARGLLRLPERPSAVFAASDTQAVGVLEAARELGLHVPEDLSLVGYDDIELAEILGLTTMRQSLVTSGRLGVELLLEALDRPAAGPRHHVLPSELVRRHTTAAPP